MSDTYTMEITDNTDIHNLKTLQQQHSELHKQFIDLQYKYKKLKYFVKQNHDNILGGGDTKHQGVLILKSNYVKTTMTPYINRFINFLEN